MAFIFRVSNSSNLLIEPETYLFSNTKVYSVGRKGKVNFLTFICAIYSHTAFL